MDELINFKDYNDIHESAVYFKNNKGEIISALYSSNAFTTYLGTAGFLNIINNELKDGLFSVNKKGFNNALEKCVKHFVNHFDQVITHFNLDTTPNFRVITNPSDEILDTENPDFVTVVNGETNKVDLSDYVLAHDLAHFRKNVASPLHEATGQISGIALISSDDYDLTVINFRNYDNIVSELLAHLEETDNTIDFLEFQSKGKHAFVQN